MKYFQRCLPEKMSEDVDISVHCDVHIFDWLVQWIHSPPQPRLDVTSVISILISSEFLQMDKLVEHCLEFLSSRVEEILRMPIDLACLSDKLVHRLAERYDAEALSDLVDSKGKLLPRLYKKRLEIDFRRSSRDDTSKIIKCRYCCKLFPLSAQPLLPCPQSPQSIDLRGALASQHAPSATRDNWSLTAHVGDMHSDGYTWEQIYWTMWGATNIFKCETCDAWFAAQDLARCCKYQEDGIAGRDGDNCEESSAAHQCCGAPCLQFVPFTTIKNAGCKSRQHRVDEGAGMNSASSAAFKLLKKQSKLFDATIHRSSLRSDDASIDSLVHTTEEKRKKKQQNPSQAPDAQQRPNRRGSASNSNSNKIGSVKDAAGGDQQRRRRRQNAKLPPNAIFDKLEDEEMRGGLQEVPSAAEQPQEDFSVFRVSPGIYEKTNVVRSLLCESKQDVLDRRELLSALSPRRRRTWELDCIWREADALRTRRLVNALCARRKPWNDQVHETTKTEQQLQHSDLPQRRRSISLGSTENSSERVRRWR